MSEVFEMDVNGDGVEDVVAYEELPDGGIIAGADTDGDGLFDVMTYDADGDGAPEEIWEEGVGVYDAPPAEAVGGDEAPDYSADYSSSGSTYDVATMSEIQNSLHEANMTIINNI